MITNENTTGRLLGYAGVSTDDQELNLQIDALLQNGIKREHIFCDKISGANVERPGLTRCLEALQPGDTLMVWQDSGHATDLGLTGIWGRIWTGLLFTDGFESGNTSAWSATVP